MGGTEILRAARRRWAVVAAVLILAVVGGWLSSRVAPPGPQVQTYEARTVLFSTRSGTFSTAPGIVNLETVAALAKVGEVPQRAAERLDFGGDPLSLAEEITAGGNSQTGLVRITATSRDPERARLISQTFAEELVGFLQERNALTVNSQAETLDERIKVLKREITNLDRRISQAGIESAQGQLLTAERDAKIQEHGLAVTRFQELAAQEGDPLGLQIIQDAVPVAVPTDSFFQVRSVQSRLILAVILGALAAAGLVFLLERFDTRIRTKGAAEQAFELPVLAEVPLLPRRRRGELAAVTVSNPKSLAADAFRILAAGVMRRPPEAPQVILVTSAGPAEGKTTVAANLAAAYSGVGKKVLVISCDLHRPRVHQLLGVPNTRGLSDVLEGTKVPSGGGEAGHVVLDGHVWKTRLDNVRLIPSGPAVEKPADLLASERMGQLIREARQTSDIVILDTPPLLAVSDATALFPEADAVLVSTWAGKTTAEAARRTNELLLRLGAPALGAVLNGVTGDGVRGAYYRYHEQVAGNSRRSGGSPSLSRRGIA